MNKKVVLIGHKKRQGKDTFAGMLGFPIIRFADPMKDIVADTFGITREQLDFAKNNGRFKAFLKYRQPVFAVVNFRRVLQRFANGEMKRYFGRSVWAGLACKEIRKSTSSVTVVADFRFKEEWTAVQEGTPADTHVIPVKVVRPSVLSGDQHESEVALNDFDFWYTVENDGSLWSLKRKANAFVNQVLRA